MCLAIPALIQSTDGDFARVDIGGISRSISILLTPDVKAGDYVLIHTGYAISVLDQEKAKETLKLFEEMARIEEEREIR